MISKRLNTTGTCYSINFPNGTVYYSYKTPVAYKLSNSHIFGTKEKFSVTTSKHQAKYIGCNSYLDKEVFDKNIKMIIN